MSKIILILSLVLFLVYGVFSPVSATGGGKPTPPQRPLTGYGSAERYIATKHTLLQAGCPYRATRVSCFVPNVLKNGNKAPVVVFLHGFKLVRPDFYMDFITHLTKQGYIVVYPWYNIESIILSLFDTDQNVFMKRAIENTNRGLSLLGDRADLRDVTVFGHSLGALLASCWIGSGGVRPKAVLMANPSTDPSQGIPDFIRQFIRINPIDWRNLAKKANVPAFVLTGDKDNLAPPSQALDLYAHLTGAPSRAVYCLQTDNHGEPPIVGNHNMALTGNWLIPEFLMDLGFGGTGRVDNADWRYIWSALDAVLDNRTELNFDMGSWSDGVPVRPITRLAP